MQLAGLPSGGVRLPLCELQSQNLKTLSETLNGYLEFNDLVREGKKVRR
jgi:dihydrodipicolinate synthase/N-acetylneuraminate lyase